MTALPKFLHSAIIVLNRAGTRGFEDFEALRPIVANRRSFGPKAFATVEDAMPGWHSTWGPARDPDAVNRATGNEQMKDAPPDPTTPSDLPRIAPRRAH